MNGFWNVERGYVRPRVHRVRPKVTHDVHLRDVQTGAPHMRHALLGAGQWRRGQVKGVHSQPQRPLLINMAAWAAPETRRCRSEGRHFTVGHVVEAKDTNDCSWVIPTFTTGRRKRQFLCWLFSVLSRAWLLFLSKTLVDSNHFWILKFSAKHFLRFILICLLGRRCSYGYCCNKKATKRF